MNFIPLIFHYKIFLYPFRVRLLIKYILMKMRENYTTNTSAHFNYEFKVKYKVKIKNKSFHLDMSLFFYLLNNYPDRM